MQTDAPMSENEALAAAITAIGSSSFIPRALDYLRQVTLFGGCFLTLLDARRPPVHIYDTVRAERRAEVVDRYLDGAYMLDPFYVAHLEHPRLAALRLRDVAPDRFQHSSYYRQYYETIRLQDEAAVLVDLPNGTYLFYSIGRLGDQPRFSQRDIGRIRAVLPVFASINRRHFANDAGRPYLTDDAALARREIEAAMDRFGDDILTERERQIAILVLKGHSSKSIAARIDVSPGTVKIHRKNFYKKLSVSSQSELFHMFLRSLSLSETA